MRYDTPDAIYNHPAALFVAGFTGAPPMNLSDCTLVDGQADVGGVRLPLHTGLAKAAASAGSLKIGVRPENVSLTALNANDIRLPAEVMLLEPLGSETLVTMKIGYTEWITRCAASFKEKRGHKLDLFVPADALRLFDAASGQAITV